MSLVQRQHNVVVCCYHLIYPEDEISVSQIPYFNLRILFFISAYFYCGNYQQFVIVHKYQSEPQLYTYYCAYNYNSISLVEVEVYTENIRAGTIVKDTEVGERESVFISTY